MAEFVAAQAAVLMVPSIKGFHSKLKTALETVRQDLTIQVKAQTDKMLAEIATAKKAAEATPIDLRVKVHDKEYIKQITEIRHKYENLGSEFRKGLRLNIAVTGAQLLPQLGVAVAALNESIVSLSQNALLLPAAFSAAAASISTLLLGTRGLKDAFKAYGDAQKSAVDDARRLRDAQRSVTDANRDYARALKDSQRNLRDLNLEMRGARLSEAEAILNVREAQQELSQTYGKSALQQQRDNLQLQQAEQRLAEVRNRNSDLAKDTAEANAKGARGADNVVAALDRVKNAQEGIQEASKGGNGLAEALGKLSPNARSFVAAIQQLQAPFAALRSGLQDRIFADLDRDVVSLAGTSLPMLERGLGGIGTAWNRNIRTLIAELGSGSNQGLIGKILGDTGNAQSRLSNAVKPMVDAFLRLSAIGSGFLPRLSTGFGQLMTRFDAFVKRSEESGKMDEWIKRAIEAAKNLGNSLINIGTIMNTITEGFVGSGGKGFLQWFQEATKRASVYLKTAEGQQRITKFFADARNVLREFQPILSALPSLFGAAKDGAQAWASLLLPFLKAAGALLSTHPGLVNAALFAYLSWKSISPIITGVAKGLEFATAGLTNFTKKVQAAEGPNGRMAKGLGRLTDFVGGAAGGPIGIGLTAIAAVLAYKYIDAQQRAAGAVQDHANSVNQLKAALDDVTGVMDKAGLAQLGKELTDYSSSGGAGQKLDHVNALGLAEKGGVDRGSYLNSFVGENSKLRGETLQKLDGIVQSDLAASQFWGRYGDKYADVGITKELLSRALNGDQGAISEFQDKINNNRVDFQIKGKDLFQIQNELGQDAHDASTAAGILRERTDTGSGVSQDLRKTNEALNGKATLNQQGFDRFNAFGTPRASASPDGGVDITVDKMPPPGFVKDVEANGGSVKETASGGAQIHLGPDRAKLYTSLAPPVRRAGGGMMAGPGTGTSDSILARLSNGEFVTRAAAVSKYGPDIFHALNNGEVDPSALPGFDEGGPVFVGPKKPYNYQPPSHMPGPAVPNLTNPGLFDPATGTFGKPAGPAPTPPGAPSLESPINQDAVRGVDPNRHGGASAPALTGPLPGPDPNSLVPDVPLLAPGAAQQGFGLINGLPENIQPINILSQIGEILLGAVLSFFGIDPTYFNLGKQVIQGTVGKKGILGGGAADPQVEELLKQDQGRAQVVVPGQAAPSGNASPLSAQFAATPAAARAAEMANSMAGKPYTWGGSTLNGTDCSGLVMYVADAYVGKPFSGRDGSTANEADRLKARGAIIVNDPSQVPSGTLRVGWNDHHTAGTLPDGRSFEASDFGIPIHVGEGASGWNSKQFTQWAYFPANGYASGGMLRGPGSGTSDSMLARVSNGEFVTRAASVAKYGPDLFHALNTGAIDPSMLPGFDDGGMIKIPGLPAPSPTPPGQSAGPLPIAPPPAPGPAAPSTVGAPQEGAQAPAPVTQPNPTADVNAPSQTDAATQQVGEAMGGIGDALSGVGGAVTPGAEAPEGATPNADPRSVLGAAPTNQEHNNPGLKKGIEGAASTIGGALSSAISMAGSMGSMGAAGPAAGAAGSMAAAGVQMAGQVVSGVTNVLSSLMVGTLTGGSTANASGTPMLPQPNAQQAKGPAIVNNFSGGIHTSNLEQWKQTQDRREQQQAAAYQGTPVR